MMKFPKMPNPKVGINSQTQTHSLIIANKNQTVSGDRRCFKITLTNSCIQSQSLDISFTSSSFPLRTKPLWFSLLFFFSKERLIICPYYITTPSLFFFFQWVRTKEQKFSLSFFSFSIRFPLYFFPSVFPIIFRFIK